MIHTQKATTLVPSDEIHRGPDFCPHAVLSVDKKKNILFILLNKKKKKRKKKEEEKK